jgi:2-polyprenyl-3-methyl-5-hydroxy-6-metoxy-1,4-benzoquinol methylase
MDFSTRSTATELMDTEDVDAADFGRCLADLETVNKVTFAHGPTLRWLARASQGMAGFSLLDVAYGHGDMTRAIHRWAGRRGLSVRLSGVDLNPSSAIAAAAATPPGMEIAWHTSDVFAYAPTEPPDFIVSSLFTHHLSDAQVVRFLAWMEQTAVRGWFVNDLHRHPIAYHGFRAMSAAARWHRFVRHDGPVSIARSFVRADWERAVSAAGVPAEIGWKFPFRYCVGHIK